MSFNSLMPLSLGLLLLALVLLGLYTRRFCQRCDYCRRFYWWIGWSAFEWTSPTCQHWTMRCRHCRWLMQQVQSMHEDTPRS